MAKKAKPVSETDLDTLEQQIPLYASEATHSAYLRALQSSQHGVLRTDDGELVRIAADGTRTLLAKAKPRRKVKVGEVITVRKVDDAATGGHA